MSTDTLWYHEKERNGLLNDTLNTFYYGYMVKDHSDSKKEKKSAIATSWATLSNKKQGIFLYM